tara:strand:- start:312 stop:548 length:237 start_codon:yes stop_codon:yes gene_type:complete
MNLLYAAESIVKAKIDEHGFIMNTCIHDQASENLDKFLTALNNYQKAVAEYEIIQGLKNQIQSEEETPEENNLSETEN